MFSGSMLMFMLVVLMGGLTVYYIVKVGWAKDDKKTPNQKKDKEDGDAI